MTAPPNILYIHSHDTGRFVQPYGYQIPTPNIQMLADQGAFFRQAFCASPTCSGSRASLLTGQYCHSNGMFGLAHRGWGLNDYGHHLVHPLRAAGYHSALLGEQHVSIDPGVIGFGEVIDVDSNRLPTSPRLPTMPSVTSPSRSFSRWVSSRPTATSRRPPRFATRCIRCRRRTCPTRAPPATTWPPSSRAPARSTRGSER